MKLSLIIPLHNEEENLDRLMKEVLKALQDFKDDFEVLLVDDCSSDRTGYLAEEWASKYHRVRVIHRRGSPGFGKALKEGFKEAEGDILIPFMGDLSDIPEDALKLYGKVAYEGYDIAVGARWRRGGWAQGMPLLKRIFSVGFSKISRLLLGTPTADVTNAFKAYRRRVITEVNPVSDGFDISAELLIKAYFKGYKITDVPVGWRGRVKGEAKLKLARMGVGYFKLLLTSFLNHKLRRNMP